MSKQIKWPRYRMQCHSPWAVQLQWMRMIYWQSLRCIFCILRLEVKFHICKGKLMTLFSRCRLLVYDLSSWLKWLILYIWLSNMSQRSITAVKAGLVLYSWTPFNDGQIQLSKHFASSSETGAGWSIAAYSGTSSIWYYISFRPIQVFWLTVSMTMQELDAQELDNQLLEPAPVPSTRLPQRPQPSAAQHQAMPNVPNRKVPAKPAKTAEELELEQIEAEMAQWAWSRWTRSNLLWYSDWAQQQESPLGYRRRPHPRQQSGV